MNINGKMVEQAKIVNGLKIAVPSTSTPDYVCMKNYQKCTIIVSILNGTTVTGSAITVKQATDVGNSLSDEKALAFDTMWANLDEAATDTLVSTAVTSNTFTTLTTNSKIARYVIEIDAAMLDTANGFDCIRAGTGNAANILTTDVLYILWGAKYDKATPPSAIID